MEIVGAHIRDALGRALILRGCSLEQVDPPNLESIWEQFAAQGMSAIQFLLPWERVEHEGPGVYDEAYLAALRKFLLAAGLPVLIQPVVGDLQALEDPATGERFLASLRHAYRRVKSCAALAGWRLQDGNSLAAAFARRMGEANSRMMILPPEPPGEAPPFLPDLAFAEDGAAELPLAHGFLGTGGFPLEPLRPYPIATAGTPISLGWEEGAQRLRYRFQAEGAIEAATEFYAPRAYLGSAPHLEAKPDSLLCGYDPATQRIRIENAGYTGVAELAITKTGP